MASGQRKDGGEGGKGRKNLGASDRPRKIYVQSVMVVVNEGKRLLW